MAHKEIKPRGYWDDYDNCYNEAKKYTSRTEFKKKSPGACKSARKHKWLNDYTWLKRPKPANIKWDDIALVMQEVFHIEILRNGFWKNGKKIVI
jgi:hypothetical protein